MYSHGIVQMSIFNLIPFNKEPAFSYCAYTVANFYEVNRTNASIQYDFIGKFDRTRYVTQRRKLVQFSRGNDLSY